MTNDAEVAERLRLLRNYGQREKNVHSLMAFNSRLDTLQAAVLLVKLPYLDDWNNQRRKAAAWYCKYLQDSELVLPTENPDCRHVYHLFVVKHERRDQLMEYLKEQQIFCGIHYPCAVPSRRTLCVGANHSPQSSGLLRTRHQDFFVAHVSGNYRRTSPTRR